MKRSIIVFCLFLLCLSSVVLANEHLYSTWDVIELDTCASAWLIRNFVDKEAEFKFYSKGEIITEGIAFDTPDAEFRRYHNMSAFESILRKHKFDDAALIEMGEIMHDIEVNFWGDKTHRYSDELSREISDIITNEKDEIECFRKSFIVFDELYKTLNLEAK